MSTEKAKAILGSAEKQLRHVFVSFKMQDEQSALTPLIELFQLGTRLTSYGQCRGTAQHPAIDRVKDVGSLAELAQRYLKSTNVDLLMWCCQALGVWAGASAINFLKAVIERWAEDKATFAAIQSLEKIGGAEAHAFLQKVSQASFASEAVRQSAGSALIELEHGGTNMWVDPPSSSGPHELTAIEVEVRDHADDPYQWSMAAHGLINFLRPKFLERASELTHTIHQDPSTILHRLDEYSKPRPDNEDVIVQSIRGLGLMINSQKVAICDPVKSLFASSDIQEQRPIVDVKNWSMVVIRDQSPTACFLPRLELISPRFRSESPDSKELVSLLYETYDRMSSTVSRVAEADPVMGAGVAMIQHDLGQCLPARKNIELSALLRPVLRAQKKRTEEKAAGLESMSQPVPASASVATVVTKDRLPERPRSATSPRKTEVNIYVGNLSWSCTDSDLEKLFGEFGVAHAQIMADRETGRSRGFGFVRMEDAEAARKAIEALNGSEFQGRSITVNEARPRESRSRGW